MRLIEITRTYGCLGHPFAGTCGKQMQRPLKPYYSDKFFRGGSYRCGKYPSKLPFAQTRRIRKGPDRSLRIASGRSNRRDNPVKIVIRKLFKPRGKKPLYLVHTSLFILLFPKPLLKLLPAAPNIRNRNVRTTKFVSRNAENRPCSIGLKDNHDHIDISLKGKIGKAVGKTAYERTGLKEAAG